MKFALLNIHHAFISAPNQLDVTLAIVSVHSELTSDNASISVILKGDNVKNLTISEIEKQAIARAEELLAL